MTKIKLIESTKLLIQKYNDLVRDLNDEERSKIMLKSISVDVLRLEERSKEDIESYNKSVLHKINQLKKG